MTASTAPDGVVTTVTIEGGRIFVRTPAVMWPRCEEIPGKIHKKEIGAWTYPPSPSSAQALLDAFRGTRVQADLGFRDLVRQANAAKGATAAKTATDLPPIPRTRTKPWLHQLRAYHFAYPLHGAMLGMDMGPQPLHALVLTPGGWKEMGQVEVGDEVIGKNGLPTRVEAVFDRGMQEVFRVEFSDGSSTLCTDTHLWEVSTPNRRVRRMASLVMPLGVIRKRLHDKHGNRLWFIPLVEPVHFKNEHTALPISPYLLGCILGDGSITGCAVMFTTADAEMVDLVAAELPHNLVIKKYSSKYGYGISRVDRKSTVNPVLCGLRSMGIMGRNSLTKMVPPEYLFTSPENRLALLQGLMDTDGHASPSRAEFCSKSWDLSAAVRFIVQSLGGRARITKKVIDGTVYWRVGLCLPDGVNPFRLTRKASILTGRPKYPPSRAFEKVVPVGPMPVRCIQVAAKDGLYVTDNFVVTHNTGKSKVAVDLVVNRDHRRVLVLAPLAVIQEWPGQFQTHVARPVMVYRPYDRRSVREMENTYASKGSDPIVVCPLDDKAGSVRDKVAGAKMAFHYADLSAGSTVIVMNYDAVWREPMAEFVMNAGWDCVIGDELHRIQAANGKASKFMGRLGDKVPWRIGLTGTPFSSGPLSIYGQYRFLDKGVFGTLNTEFKRKYCRMGGYQGHQVIGYENQEELQRKFYSIAFRVESRDVLDLPEELHIEKTFDLAPETMKAYRELEEFFIAKIRQGEITVNNALTKLLRLQQMTSGFARLDATDEEEGRVVRIGTEKQELLGELIRELDKKEPICVFCRFTHDLQAVAEVCKQQGRTCGFLDGSRKDTEAWKAGQMDVLAIQIRAGGTGVNLTRSCYCFDYSLGFSLADYDQHLARLMRPGQKNMCRFFRLVANKTVDVKVFNALSEKRQVVDAILSDWR